MLLDMSFLCSGAHADSMLCFGTGATRYRAQCSSHDSASIPHGVSLSDSSMLRSAMPSLVFGASVRMSAAMATACGGALVGSMRLFLVMASCTMACACAVVGSPLIALSVAVNSTAGSPRVSAGLLAHDDAMPVYRCIAVVVALAYRLSLSLHLCLLDILSAMALALAGSFSGIASYRAGSDMNMASTAVHPWNGVCNLHRLGDSRRLIWIDMGAVGVIPGVNAFSMLVFDASLPPLMSRDMVMMHSMGGTASKNALAALCAPFSVSVLTKSTRASMVCTRAPRRGPGVPVCR